MKHLPSAAPAPDRPSRRRGHASIVAVIGGALVAGAALTAALSSWVACTPSDDFKCGTPLPGDTNTIRQCDVPHQICVCETNACAEPAPTKECDAGFRYVDGPFAPKERRGKCVDGPIGTSIIKAGAGNVACQDDDAGTDASDADSGGGGAGTGGSGGSGGASTSSSSTSGTGGTGGTGTSSTTSSSTTSSSTGTDMGGAGGKVP